jgi:hypothetical protein
MCLRLPLGYKRKVAKKAIKCYKVVLKVGLKGFQTPYRHMVVEIGKTYDSSLFTEYGGFFIGESINIALHSFRTKKAAIIEANEWYSNSVIIQCEIPKGSVYYSGKFENENDAYASTSLKYVEIIN